MIVNCVYHVDYSYMFFIHSCGDYSIGSDYYTPPRSVTFRSGVTEASVTFRTREDSTLEDKYESVAVVAKHPLITNGTADDETVITIADDDGM